MNFHVGISLPESDLALLGLGAQNFMPVLLQANLQSYQDITVSVVSVGKTAQSINGRR